MNNLKVIKSIEQYNKYCDELERLISLRKPSAEEEEKIDLLTVLIEKWDNDHFENGDIHPVEILKQLMEMQELSAIALAKSTGIDKTVLSKILNYKKGFSKEVIIELAGYFKVNQAAFNKPYSITEADEKVIKKFKSTLTTVSETSGKYIRKKS
ncbi:MAG: helix-turn-helix domain-containing protein [Chitinophagales bacterium]